MALSGCVARVRDLAFRHRADRPLLEWVSFELRAGERLGVLGGPGSGKSSLLQLLVGLRAPHAGSIELFGAPCRGTADFRALRGRVGLLFQDAGDQLFRSTVDDNVAFGLLNQGLARDVAWRAALDTLHGLGLLHLAGRRASGLAEGERRLVALAGVLAMQPGLVLLDEPLAGLRPPAREAMAKALETLPQTLVIASREAAPLRRLAARTMVLHGGALLALPAGEGVRG